MNEALTCLILKQTDYRENDALVTVLSKQYGKLSIVARGIRKSSSKNAGKLLPYTKAEILIDYREDKTIFTAKNVSVKNVYLNLHQNLEASTCAAVMCEVSDSLLLNGTEGEMYQKIYEDLDTCFLLLDQKEDTNTVLSLFLVEIMRCFGISPHVDSCVLCGATTVSSISIKDGGFLCASCANQSGSYLYDPLDLKRFRLLVKGGLKHFDAIKKSGGAASSDTKNLIEILRMHAGISIRSYNLFERLFFH